MVVVIAADITGRIVLMNRRRKNLQMSVQKRLSVNLCAHN